MMFNLKDTRYMQYLAAVTAALSSISVGTMISWPSPTLPILQSENSPIGAKISDEEGSWVVASLLLGTIFASFVTGWCVDYFGRKKVLLSVAILSLIHWLMIIFASSIGVLIAARLIGGCVVAFIIPANVIYTAEIAEEDIRGKVGTYMIMFKTIGTVIVLVVGPYVSYTVLGIVCACAPVIFFCSFFTMPESPFYYVKIEKEEEAKQSLARLSKNTVDDKFLNDRLKFIQCTVERDMKNKGSLLELFTKKDYRYVLILMFGIKSLQQFNGNSALEAYIQPIIESSNTGLEPEIASIIIGVIQLPAVYLSGILVDKLGRKPLLLISTVGCCIALCGEGTFFYIKEYLGNDVSAIGWLPTAGLALFWISNPIGILSLPYVLLGELFPTNIKGAAVATATFYGGATSFIVSKFFKPLSNAIGIYSVFYIFTGICVAGALFILFFLPETKGKNFQEIQEIIHNKGKKKKNPKDENLS